jgi:hypothetical protein
MGERPARRALPEAEQAVLKHPKLQTSLLRSLATAFGQEIIHGYIWLAWKHTPTQFLGTIDHLIDGADAHLMPIQFDNNISATLKAYRLAELRR